MKFERNLKLFMKIQIKSKRLTLVDVLGNMSCFKWNNMRVFIPCTINL